MMSLGRKAVAFVAASAFGLASLAASAETYGKLEHVKVIAATPIEVVASLDPGADGASLHAVNVKYFQRDGDTWVRFIVDNGSVLPGNRVTLERRVLKDVKVKQKGGGIEHRAVVEMELCVGERTVKTRVTIADRTGFTAPLIIGQAELTQLGSSVDGKRQFTHEPNCKLPEAVVSSPQQAGEQRAASRPSAASPPVPEPQAAAPQPALHSGAIVAFKCDGRTYCSQMHSCEEAEFFLNNCPGVKMDGNNDGVPCEKQWCH